jgi:hypothetical protein
MVYRQLVIGKGLILTTAYPYGTNKLNQQQPLHRRKNQVLDFTYTVIAMDVL